MPGTEWPSKPAIVSSENPISAAVTPKLWPQHVNRDTGEIGASAYTGKNSRQPDEMTVPTIGLEDTVLTCQGSVEGSNPLARSRFFKGVDQVRQWKNGLAKRWPGPGDPWVDVWRGWHRLAGCKTSDRALT
jgi:hypothetical protein